MIPDLPTEGMYEDAKSLIARIGMPLVAPMRRRLHRKALLGYFSADFAHHPAHITDIVDYYTFYEHVDNWLTGNGVLNAATYGETLRFWTTPHIFLPYEAKLMRFLKRGGDVRRIFVIGPEVHDPIRFLAMYRTLKRHEALGFHPHVLSVVDLQPEVERIGISCDMFGVLNGSIVYFFRFPENDEPIMVRTTDRKQSNAAEKVFATLWRKAHTSDSWISRWHTSIPKSIRDIIKRDIECVEMLSEESST